MATIKALKENNIPQRKFMRKESQKLVDRQTRVKSTLLEYGQQNILLSSLTLNQQDQQSQDKQKNLTSLKQIQDQQSKSQATISAEETNLKKLINEMSDADHKQVFILHVNEYFYCKIKQIYLKSRVTASAVGQILGLQQSTLQQIVNEFTNKVRINLFSNVKS